MTDDAATLAAIATVSKDVRELRVDLSTRMDAMVTRREHDAEVRRIDAEAVATREALDRHEAESVRHHQSIETNLATGDALIVAKLERQEARREEQATAESARRVSDRRWSFGAVMTAAALAVAVGQLITRFF